MRKKSNKSSMHKQNSIILACFIIPVLLSGCGIKGPLTQKPVQAETQKQDVSTENNTKTEQNKTSAAQQPQEN